MQSTMKAAIILLITFHICNTFQHISFNFNFPDINNSHECEIDYFFVKGYCKKLSECVQAQNYLIQYGIRPTICSFHRHEPIVCCPKDNTFSSTTEIAKTTKTEILKTTTEISRTTTTDITKTAPLTNLRISEINCLEQYNPENQVFGASAVGGVPAQPREFPFMAALGWSSFTNEIDFNCGGFLISPKFVLSVAHCMSIGGAAPKFVLIGGDNLTMSQANIPINRIWIHPEYKNDEIYNDIAIIELSFNSFEKPACLQQTNTDPPGTLTAIGYGHTQFAGRRSDQLIKVFLNVINNKNCQPYFQPAPDIPDGIKNSQLCAGDPNRKMDTCQGDSGGPLFYYNDDRLPYVIGLTSFGQGCAGEAPSIYTRISHYLNWIEPIVWPA